jgi:muconolactone delta-isomerase
MEFLVKFEPKVRAGTPAPEVEQRDRTESAAAGKFTPNRHLVRLWRQPLAGDPIGLLYRADSKAELDNRLDALPPADWLRVTVTAHKPQASDPTTVFR